MNRSVLKPMISVIMLLLAVADGYAQPQGKPLPQILLHFDEPEGRPLDTSGCEHGVENHDAKAGAPGKFARAYEFDGEKSHLDAGNNYGITFCFPAQTIEFWVNPRKTGKEMGILGSQEKPTRSSWRWNFSYDTNAMITFTLWDGEQKPNTRGVTSRSAAPPGRWTHVAVTLDAGATQKMRLFINGREEAFDSLKSVAPFGSLFIGSANAGFFDGMIDDLAIYNSVLSDNLIARHASGEGPIPDGLPQAVGRQGFRIFPLNGAATVAIRHSEFPGRSWKLRIPEWAYKDPNMEKPTSPSGILWQPLEDGSLEFRWHAPDELKKKYRLDYWGRLKPGDDNIEYELTGKNVGDKAWGEKPWGGVLSLICLGAGGNSDFHDYDAKKTFIRKEGRWITMNEVIGGKFQPHRMAGIAVKREGKAGAERLAAKVSNDDEWVSGIATDIAGSLSFNFQLRVSCMHSNPVWPELRPGEQASAKGRIYLLKGGLDTLWERYKKDFPE